MTLNSRGIADGDRVLSRVYENHDSDTILFLLSFFTYIHVFPLTLISFEGKKNPLNRKNSYNLSLLIIHIRKVKLKEKEQLLKL